jgi:hypothetical protein
MKKLVSDELTMAAAFWILFALCSCGGGDALRDHCKSFCELMIECGNELSDLNSCTSSCIENQERNITSSWDETCESTFNAWVDCFVAIKDCCAASCSNNPTCYNSYVNYSNHCLSRPGG